MSGVPQFKDGIMLVIGFGLRPESAKVPGLKFKVSIEENAAMMIGEGRH